MGIAGLSCWLLASGEFEVEPAAFEHDEGDEVVEVPVPVAHPDGGLDPVVDGLELPENLKSAGELQAQSTDVIPWCGMYSSNSDVNAVVNGMFAELLAGSVDGAGFVSGVQSQLQ